MNSCMFDVSNIFMKIIVADDISCQLVQTIQAIFIFLTNFEPCSWFIIEDLERSLCLRHEPNLKRFPAFNDEGSKS